MEANASKSEARGRRVGLARCGSGGGSGGGTVERRVAGWRGWRGGGVAGWRGGGGDAGANLEVGVLGEEEPHVGVAPVLPLELRTRPPTRPWRQPCSHPRRSMERGLALSLNGGTPLQGRAGILR